MKKDNSKILEKIKKYETLRDKALGRNLVLTAKGHQKIIDGLKTHLE